MLLCLSNKDFITLIFRNSYSVESLFEFDDMRSQVFLAVITKLNTVIFGNTYEAKNFKKVHVLSVSIEQGCGSGSAWNLIIVESWIRIQIRNKVMMRILYPAYKDLIWKKNGEQMSRRHVPLLLQDGWAGLPGAAP
jgi:hypothetical protein